MNISLIKYQARLRNRERLLKEKSIGVPFSKGLNNINNKLSICDVIYIRSSNEFNNDLAKKFGVSSVTIHKIKSYKTWKWLK